MVRVMAKAHFSPALFSFLRDLEANNDREWFNANKERYVNDVQEPALDFITDFAEPLRRISPHFQANARTQGGSLFRIYRDTRFSKDKTPYKTNTGMHFRHESAANVHAPGFYVHVEPSGSFAGAGIWRPAASVANQIREAIAGDPEGWRAATGKKEFLEVWSLTGDRLKRPPRPFPPDHSLIEELKRKDFIASTRLTQKQISSKGFLRDFTVMCERAAPFVAFLCRAVGVPF